MSDLPPKSRILLERLQPAFAPSEDMRRRMREAVLARAAEMSAARSGEGTDDSPPESGIRLALRAHFGKLLAGALLVVAGSASIAHYVTQRETSPAAAEATVGLASAPPVVCTEPACASVPADRDDTKGETEHSSSPSSSPTTLRSPHDLPDAPSDRGVMARVTPRESVGPASSAGRTLNGTDERSFTPTEGRPEDLLGKEVRLIRDAQIGLRAGDLERVRSSLDEHARSFPAGVLSSERLVLGVLLLCAEGRTERARSMADELVRANLQPSHLEPLRASCAGGAVQ